MKKVIKFIWNTVTTLLASLALIFALLLVGPKIVGLDMYVVLSGSMEPNYPTGSMIYVKDVDPSELEVNDVITFQLTDNTIATHRIVEVIEENNQISYRTKGDANEHEDENLVLASNVIGKAQFAIPYMGYIVNYIQQPPGLYMAIALCVAIILMMVLSDLLFEEDKN